MVRTYKKFRYISKSKSGFLLKKYKINKQKFIFNYTGGISKHEGLEFILAAKELIKKNRNVIFFIVGDGEFLEECKSNVNKLSLEKYFIFTGWIDYSLVQNVLDISNTVIVPMPKCESLKPYNII